MYFKLTPSSGKYGEKLNSRLSDLAPRSQLLRHTFSIKSRSQRGGFMLYSSWWYHSVQMSKSFQGAMIVRYFPSKSSLYDMMSKTAWAPMTFGGKDVSITAIIIVGLYACVWRLPYRRANDQPSHLGPSEFYPPKNI